MIAPEIALANRSPIGLHGVDQLITPSNRYILAKVGDRTVTFPDLLVSEIIIIDRSAILALPFYTTAIVGVIHHQAQVMPLLLLQLVLEERSALIKESLTIVRLSKLADDLSDQHLSGVGIIVDRVIGSLTTDEYQAGDFHSPSQGDRSNLISDATSETKVGTKKINQTVANMGETEYTPIEIVLSSISTHIWQPQRWQIT
ncbi:MAG: chemotaxis protein CheW [Pseudanabaena sp.]|jgi:chemotaxis signal transduction protein